MGKAKFGVFKLVLLCALVAIIAAVPSLASAKSKRQKLDDFNPDEDNVFQGVLCVWNVDTFEGGSQSKSVFLERAGMNFASQNKGAFVLVKNLSVEELIQNLLAGVQPDVISFGHGVGDVVKPVLADLTALEMHSVRQEVLNAGKIDNTQLAIGYLMGGYVLASTEEKLAAASVDNSLGLLTLVDSAGFDTKGKNGQVVHTSSVVAGENVYIDPVKAVGKVAGKSLADVHTSSSMYDAYMDFVAYNKGTILVGTQRDLFKLSGRVAVGKISGVKLEYLSGFTNLVQYVGVAKGMDEKKSALAKKFVEYLVCEDAQKLSCEVGMINTIGKNFYEDGEFLALENTLNKTLIVPNLFA